MRFVKTLHMDAPLWEFQETGSFINFLQKFSARPYWCACMYCTCFFADVHIIKVFIYKSHGELFMSVTIQCVCLAYFDTTKYV